MGNLIYDNDFYNKEVKERFLSQFDEPSKTTFGRIFKRSFYLESEMNKDLFDFNRDDLRRFFKTLTPKNSMSSRVNASLTSNYMDWSIDEGYRNNTLNPLHGLDLEWHDEFVDKSKKTLFTEAELDEVISKLQNYQDSVIIRLLFEGVTGGDGFQELINLTKHDVDWDNKILKLNDGNGRVREISVSDECLRLIQAALDQKEYKKRNGDVSPKIKAPTLRLHENDYIIRNTVARGATNGKVDYFTIKRRLSTAGELFEYPSFNPSNIQDSGMLKMAKDILEEKTMLDNSDYEVILERFGANKSFANGGMMYNFYGPKRRFLNEERIREVYGEKTE